MGLPITLLANDALLRVARPKSPIFTDPVGPVMKMLSHLRSRWMMGGVLVCRNSRPFRICRHQLRSTLGFITLNRFRYLGWGRGSPAAHGQRPLCKASPGAIRPVSEPVHLHLVLTCDRFRVAEEGQPILLLARITQPEPGPEQRQPGQDCGLHTGDLATRAPAKHDPDLTLKGAEGDVEATTTGQVSASGCSE